MSKPTVTAAQIVHIGTALEKAANEVGLKLYDFAAGHLIAPVPNVKINGNEVPSHSYMFILEPSDE